MSKMEDAHALVAVGLDGARPAAERLSALEAANGLRRELKVGWSKLGAPEGFNLGAELAELREAQAPGDAETPQGGEQPSADVPPEPKTERGGIGRLVNLLLTESADDYATIVAKVKERYPEAKTTARSVASVAADLRRDGVDVPTRRRAKSAPAAE